MELEHLAEKVEKLNLSDEQKQEMHTINKALLRCLREYCENCPEERFKAELIPIALLLVRESFFETFGDA